MITKTISNSTASSEVRSFNKSEKAKTNASFMRGKQFKTIWMNHTFWFISCWCNVLTKTVKNHDFIYKPCFHFYKDGRELKFPAFSAQIMSTRDTQACSPSSKLLVYFWFNSVTKTVKFMVLFTSLVFMSIKIVENWNPCLLSLSHVTTRLNLFATPTRFSQPNFTLCSAL